MASTMRATTIKVSAAQRASVRPAKVAVSASLRTEVAKVTKAAGVSVASLALALSANAATIKMGADNGALVFEPANVTVSAGEEITWVNNAGFPHNIIFDEDEVPSGVDADAISNEDTFNAPGEKYSLKLSTPGTYGYYCAPHQGAGMVGKITVQ